MAVIFKEWVFVLLKKMGVVFLEKLIFFNFENGVITDVLDKGEFVHLKIRV